MYCVLCWYVKSISLYVHLMTIYITSIAYLYFGTNINLYPYTKPYTIHIFTQPFISHSVIYNINTYVYMNISIMCLRIVYLYYPPVTVSGLRSLP